MGTVLGLRSTDPDILALARSMGLGPAGRFAKIELPGALSYLFAGLKERQPWWSAWWWASSWDQCGPRLCRAAGSWDHQHPAPVRRARPARLDRTSPLRRGKRLGALGNPLAFRGQIRPGIAAHSIDRRCAWPTRASGRRPQSYRGLRSWCWSRACRSSTTAPPSVGSAELALSGGRLPGRRTVWSPDC